MLTDYISTASGNRLERKDARFFYKDRYFPGLVDVAENALYDDPEDSFAKYAGIPSSMEEGLIRKLDSTE